MVDRYLFDHAHLIDKAYQEFKARPFPEVIPFDVAFGDLAQQLDFAFIDATGARNGESGLLPVLRPSPRQAKRHQQL